MMLWYKAWRETRTRFFLAGLILVGFCLASALVYGRQAGELVIPVLRRGATYAEHIYNVVYSGTAKGVFALLVIFLALGGLRREQSRRTATLTLSLPVTRSRVLAAGIGVGLLEIVALTLLPMVLVPAVSALVGRSYPFDHAIHFAVLWVVGGAAIFGVTFLISACVAGDYTPLVAGYLVLSLETLVAGWGPLAPYHLNLMQTMGEFGTMRWNAEHTLLAPGPMPWVRLIVIGLVAAVSLGAAVRVTNRQDF